MKDKYMNAIIYESQRVPIIIDKNYSLLEILILKINIENIKKVQKDIIQEIEEISEKFNNFKSYEKIYFNVNNKFIYFDKDCYNKEGKYEALKKEISENIKKMKLKEEIESEESKMVKKMEEKYNSINKNYIFKNEKKLEEINKDFNIKNY